MSSSVSSNDIFESRIKPVMDVFLISLEKHQAEEREKFYQANSASLMMGGNMARLGLERHLNENGMWSSKTLDNVLADLKRQFQSSGITIDAVLEKKMVDYLIEKNAPRDKVEYIMQTILDGNPLLDTRRTKTDFEAHVYNEAKSGFEQKTSTTERIGAEAASLSVNVASLGPANALGFVKTAVVEGVKMTAENTLSSNGDASKYLAEQKQLATKEVREAQEKQVVAPKWMDTVSGFSSKSEATQEQLNKALQWSINNYIIRQTAIATAIANNSRVISISGKQESVTDATVRAKEYSYNATEILRAASDRNLGLFTPEWMSSQMGFKNIKEASDKQLDAARNWAAENRAIRLKAVDQSVANGFDYITVSGKRESISDAIDRAFQYEAFVMNILSEEERRDKAKQAQKEIAEAKETAESVRTNEGKKEEAAAPSQAQASQTSQSAQPAQPSVQSSEKYSGWNGLFSATGLDGMGKTLQNLGPVLAKLPDLLIGMFTGKTKTLGMNAGTLVPIAALILGSMTGNKLLKIPLMLFGGMSLLNRMGKEALTDQQQSQSSNLPNQTVRYKKYPDEVLNERLSRPHVEGNVLIVDIDRVPKMVTMPSSLADAYHSGAIPLNTLANHILAKTDIMQQQSVTTSQDVSQNYEQSQQREQVRGIR